MTSVTPPMMVRSRSTSLPTPHERFDDEVMAGIAAATDVKDQRVRRACSLPIPFLPMARHRSRSVYDVTCLQDASSSFTTIQLSDEVLISGARLDADATAEGHSLVQEGLEAVPPSQPHRRTLRERHAAQLNPYTTEMMRYRASLVRNDWQDAVVISAEIARAARLKRREGVDDQPNEAGDALRVRHSTEGGSSWKEGAGVDKEGVALAGLTAASSDNQHPVSRARKRHRALSDSEESQASSPEPTPDVWCVSSGSSSNQAHTSNAATVKRSRPAEERRDYHRLFRTLRRTMPAKMARLYIDDLKAMDAEGVNEDSNDQLYVRLDDGTAGHHEALRPGETRRRQASKSRSAANWGLLLSQSESEADDSSASTSQVLSPVPLPSATTSMPRYVQTGEKYAASEQHRRAGLKKTRLDSRKTLGDDLDVLLSKGNPGRLRRDKQGPPSSKKTKSITDSGQGMNAERSRQRGVGPKDGSTAVESYRGQSSSISYLRPLRPADASRFRSRYCIVDVKELFADPGGNLVGSTYDSLKAAEMQYSRRGGLELSGDASPLEIPSSSLDIESKPYIRRSGPAQVPLKEILTPQSVQSAINTEDSVEIATGDAMLEAWRYAGPFPLTFGIDVPPIGLRCHPQSFIGRGKLYALLHPAQATPSLPHINSDFEQAELFDRVLAALRSSDDLQLRIRLEIMSDAILARTEITTPDHYERDRILRGLWRFVDDCIAQAGFHFETGQYNEVRLLVTSSLQWLHIAVSWQVLERTIDRPIAERPSDAPLTEIREEAINMLRRACGDLMLTLLSHGLHRTISALKSASQELIREGTVQDIEDDSVYFWVSVIHLLSGRFATRSLSSHGCFDSPPFWPVLMDALAQYQTGLLKRKGAYITSENTWYTLNAIHALGHFTATTGSASSESPIARPYWPLVLRALSLQKLRFEEQEELAASSLAIYQRDTYIRTALRRVDRLLNGSAWQPADLESILAYFYTLFDSHRLQNLPSENLHDFSAFLRFSDPGLLQMEPSVDDSAFDTFTLILAKSVERIRQSSVGGEKRGGRAVERILSRFSPMRTLPFTTETVPTSLQRSSLYNHYNIALLYLFLVPSSSERRLLQLQQYLRLTKADYKSKIICIRAMMYAGLLVNSHNGALGSVMDWFSSTFFALLRQLRTMDDSLSKISAHSTSSKAERELAEQKTIVAACLRAVQYVIQGDEKFEVGSVGDSRARVLPIEWFRTSLDPLFVTRNPTVALETLRLLQCYLKRYAERQNRLETQRTTLLTGSQDSYSDLFDSIDLDDAALLRASGYATEREGRTSGICEDDEVVALFDEGISPILFSLINYIAQEHQVVRFALAAQESVVPCESARMGHSDSRRSFDHGLSLILDETSCLNIGPLLVQLWARCGRLLVRGGIRSWDHYLRGAEDLRLLSLDVARQNVTVAFFTEILGNSLDEEVNAVSASRHPYLGNFWDIWTSVLTFLALPRLPMGYAYFLILVAQHETKQVHRSSILSDDRTEKGELVTDGLRTEFDWQARWALIVPILSNLPSTGPPKDVIKALSAMLTSVRLTARRLAQKLASTSGGDTLSLQASGDDDLDEHLKWRAFALHIIASSQRSLPGTILCGLSEDLRRTHHEVNHLE